MKLRAPIATLLLGLGSAPVFAGPLDDLPADTWYEIPESHADAVAHDWSPESTPGRFRAIVDAWGGGAFDTREHRMLLHGGGHGDYGGSEVYAMDLDIVNDDPGTNPWAKLSEPDLRSALDPDCENEDNLTDNDHRRSQHTYGRLAYVPALHALCDTGGSIGYVYCPAARRTDCFDLTSNTWQLGLSDGLSSGTGSVGAVHPTSGEWWLLGGQGSGRLGRFDANSLAWTYGPFDNIPGSSPRNLSAAIDPVRNRMVFVGSGRFWALDLDAFDPDTTEPSEHPVEPRGEIEIVDAKSPGLAYDPEGDRFVAWNGGSDVFLLDAETLVWTRMTPAGPSPGDPARNGTYGRFQYSPRYGVFVLVNATGRNVFALRLGGAAQTPMDAGVPDLGAPDAGLPEDSGSIRDAGRPDAGRPDAGRPDLGEPDLGEDGGQPDGGSMSEPPEDDGCRCQGRRSEPAGLLAGLLLIGLARRRQRKGAYSRQESLPPTDPSGA